MSLVLVPGLSLNLGWDRDDMVIECRLSRGLREPSSRTDPAFCPPLQERRMRRIWKLEPAT